MTAQQMLDWAMRQLPTRNAAVVIADGRVEVTTRQAASIPVRIDRGLVFQIRDVPLRQAIEDLADRGGFTVVIDSRCPDMTQKVSVTAQENTSPRGLLTAWADMLDCKLIVDDHRVTLMPRTDYLKKLSDESREMKLRSEITRYSDSAGVPPAGRNDRTRLESMP